MTKKLVIIVVVVLIVGGGIYFLTKNRSIDGGLKGALEELKVETPEIDISLSPLPKLNVSSLNLSSPSLPGGNIFSGFSVNTNFSYQGDMNISSPAIPQLTAPVQQQQQQPTVNAASCAAFSAIPSSQYCSMAGSSGQTLCQQCKAAGY
ncbi:MAG: hypothetical protein AAB451_03620 [Patescibacteria group bacterium]